jgi:hypothetical protein
MNLVAQFGDVSSIRLVDNKLYVVLRRFKLNFPYTTIDIHHLLQTVNDLFERPKKKYTAGCFLFLRLDQETQAIFTGPYISIRSTQNHAKRRYLFSPFLNKL